MSFFEEQLRRAIHRQLETGTDWCVTLESKQNPDVWVQFTGQFVNMHYPLAEDPVTALQHLDWPTESLDLCDWQADMYVTFSHQGDVAVTQVAAFVSDYLEKVLHQQSAESNWSVDEYDL